MREAAATRDAVVACSKDLRRGIVRSVVRPGVVKSGVVKSGVLIERWDRIGYAIEYAWYLYYAEAAMRHGRGCY